MKLHSTLGVSDDFLNETSHIVGDQWASLSPVVASLHDTQPCVSALSK
jgi:hypothetical protein